MGDFSVRTFSTWGFVPLYFQLKYMLKTKVIFKNKEMRVDWTRVMIMKTGMNQLQVKMNGY